MKFLVCVMLTLIATLCNAETVCVTTVGTLDEFLIIKGFVGSSDSDIVTTLERMVEQEIPISVRPIVLEAVTRPVVTFSAIVVSEAEPQKPAVVGKPIKAQSRFKAFFVRVLHLN